MTGKLMMMFAAVAVSFGAWAETETVGGYTWTYRIIGETIGDTAEITTGNWGGPLSRRIHLVP